MAGYPFLLVARASLQNASPSPVSVYALLSGPLTFGLLHMCKIRGDTALVVIGVALSILSAALYSVHHDIIRSVSLSALLFVLHVFSAVLATVFYRLSPLHPLAAFPGPTLNKITSLKLAYIVYTGKRHLIIKALHEKYGVFVRTGPNTLSINSHNVVTTIYSSSTCMDKSDAYLLGPPQASGLFFIPDRERHNERRAIWAGAFIPSSLRAYHPSVDRRTKQLIGCLEDRVPPGKSLNMTECLQHWAYDLMGDVVFGGCNRLELMSDGDANAYVKCGQIATTAFEILGEVPWLFDILWHLPPTHNIHALERFAGELLEERRRDTQGPHRDICAYLLGENSTQPSPLTKSELDVDALFAVQAGSDSIASVLTFAFYFLLSNPSKYQRLQAEIDGVFQDNASIDHNVLLHLPYLNAVIDESLRLGTPFAGLPRVVPKGGVTLENKFIPEGTIVGVPAYAQQVSPQNFWPEPLKFMPERWIDAECDSDTLTRRSSLMCFSYGPFSCLGRNFAINKMRLVIAYLLLALEFQFPPDFDCELFLSGMTNTRTTVFGYPLRVCVKQRQF